VLINRLKFEKKLVDGYLLKVVASEEKKVHAATDLIYKASLNN
jgi:hypothetical protein